MKYVWDYVLISWLLVKFRVLSLIPAQSNQNEETFPISSQSIQLACDNGLRVNNIDVAIRRSNTTCLTIIPECTLPNEAIEKIKTKCTKQVSCDVDIHYITNNQSCLHEYVYFNVGYTCKSIVDYSCNIEMNLCNWSPDPKNSGFRWRHGRRLSYQLPDVDHTSTSYNGKYVYISSTSPSADGDIAKLESGDIIANEQQCLSFWYYTNNFRDSVQVFQNEANMLNLSFNYEKQIWNHIQIPLEKKSNDAFKLVFQVTRGKPKAGSFGAIVIDDILIENKNCYSDILNCDFETDLCDWNTDDSNQYVWQKQRGQSPVGSTGPSTDHSTASGRGYYMYLASRPDDFGDETRTAYFEFQNVNLHVPGNSCLTFWYHMYHYRYGREELNVKLNDEIVWSEEGSYANKWRKGMIDLHNKENIDILFIGILKHDSFSSNNIDIAVDDILLTEGTCSGVIHHEKTCVHLEGNMHKETVCPKGYLDLQNLRLSFDPEKEDCVNIYDQSKTRLLRDCTHVSDSQKCLIDPSTDIRSQPECFQLYEFRILHTCEDEKTSTVSSDTTSQVSSAAVEATTNLSFTTSREDSSSANDDTVTFPRSMEKSSDSSETGLTVGLVVGALLLILAVIVIIILIRRQTFNSNSREKIRNNLEGNDYIGSQDIALPLTANQSRHMQTTGLYNRRSDTNVHCHDSTNAYAHNNNVQHEYTNVGAVNGLVDYDVQVPTYAHRQDKTFANNHMPNDDEYAIVEPTAETGFNENTNNRNETADSYMVLDPAQTGFNRQILSNTPVDYEFAKPLHDTENKIIEDDQYGISDGVYDHSGNNRHKESEINIYNHTVDTIYDSGSHKRNEGGREDTYDHFFGQTTEDDYDISTTT